MADDANPSPPELDWFVAADDEGQPGFIVLNGDPIEPVYLTEDFQSMAWSRDGKWLAVVNGDDCFDLRLIDMATWQMRRYLHMFGEEMGHIRTVTWAPDSSRMAYVAWPCEMEMTTTAIQVIDRDFNRLDEVDTFDGTIRRLDWSPDGKQFLILGKRAGETKEAITGSVTAQGVGLAHVHVELVDVESEGMVNQHAVATDPLGGFMFPPIPPGLYEIRVHPPPGYLAPEPIQLLIGPAPNEPLVIETEPASMQTHLPLVVHP